MNRTSIIITILIISMINASCGIGRPTPLSLSRNTIITVSAPPELNTYKLNDFVSVVVQNNSNDEIVFLPQDGLTLYMKSGENWSNIENLMPNSIGRKIILSPQNQTETSSMVVDIVPKLSEVNSVIIRILVTGKDQSTNQKVEGFVDITLSP